MGHLRVANSMFALPARLVFSFVLLAVPFLAGLAAATAWYILAIAPIFIMADVLGKWRLHFQGKPAKVLVKFLISAVVAQPIVVGVIYLLGRGIGSVAGPAEVLDFGAAINWQLLAIYAAIVLAGGFVMIFLERGKVGAEDAVKREVDAMLSEAGLPSHFSEKLDAEATPLTVDTFFTGYHHAHADHDVETGELERLSDKAKATLADIEEVEAKLGVVLPEGLRKLYQTQNGGSVRYVYSGDANEPDEDDLQPFSGYDDLNPIEYLQTVHDAVAEYTNEEDIDDFPREAKKMIVLAQWYRETLFLDYRDGRDVPRVGFVDFDDWDEFEEDGWEEGATFWADFGAFFATLYRQKRYDH